MFSSFANFGTCVPHIAVKSWIPNFACLLQIIIFLFQQFRAIPGEMDLSSLPELSHSQLLQIISQVVAELIRRASVSSEGVPIPPPTTPPLDSQVHSVRLRTPPRGQCGFKCQFCERACTRRGLEHTNHKCWNHRHDCSLVQIASYTRAGAKYVSVSEHTWSIQKKTTTNPTFAGLVCLRCTCVVCWIVC